MYVAAEDLFTGYGSILWYDIGTSQHGVLIKMDGTNGSGPMDGLTVSVDQKTLYGTTTSGGTSHLGNVFAIGTNGVFKWNNYILGGTYGADIMAGLTLHTNGTLYGTTMQGGKYGYGTIFKVDAANGNLTILQSFTNHNDGANPVGGLVYNQFSGKYYGVTGKSNGNGPGAVYAFDPNTEKMSPLYVLSGTGSANLQGLVVLPNSKMVVISRNGGDNGTGSAFLLSIDGTATPLLSFPNDGQGYFLANDGVVGPDNNIYITSYSTTNRLFKLSFPIESAPFEIEGVTTNSVRVYYAPTVRGQDYVLYYNTNLADRSTNGSINWTAASTNTATDAYGTGIVSNISSGHLFVLAQPRTNGLPASFLSALYSDAYVPTDVSAVGIAGLLPSEPLPEGSTNGAIWTNGIPLP